MFFNVDNDNQDTKKNMMEKKDLGMCIRVCNQGASFVPPTIYLKPMIKVIPI